ncbi:hypothetical protein E0H88_03600 [Acinetobacter sp. ANC 4216]|uniref:hypothetical protein n=1 Tax=Acinetobacter sp. ANC 4216 TaxID=2529840 RepID=UPI00103EC7CF|nr:hypothetical protein [Acinetobacter sp. ANC 4216]TCB72093.1 hypothetical protein E0H88_03600 [Acinetobacter sp. ANC 4216]
MAKTPSEVQKRNRRLFLEFFVSDFSDNFLIALENSLVVEFEKSSEFCNKYDLKSLRSRALGYLKYFDGSDALDKVCKLHSIPCESYTTNGHQGGDYLLAKTDNFTLAFSNKPYLSQNRTKYQKQLADSNTVLSLQQGELDFEDTIQKVAKDEERFSVTVGLEENSTGLMNLVFNVPHPDGYSIYRFYLKDLVEVLNELRSSNSDPRLDETEAKVTLRAVIKKGNL